jgi:hypothetical protein
MLPKNCVENLKIRKKLFRIPDPDPQHWVEREALGQKPVLIKIRRCSIPILKISYRVPVVENAIVVTINVGSFF